MALNILNEFQETYATGKKILNFVTVTVTVKLESGSHQYTFKKIYICMNISGLTRG